MSSPAVSNAPPTIIVPDCCNIGVVFRVLVLVNAIVLCAILLPSPGLQAGLRAFVEASMVVELACLWSLFALCALRRVLLAAPRGFAMGTASQRALCALVPAAVTGMIVRALAGTVVFQATFTHLTGFKAALTAAMFGALVQHYFELRARAFSPVLVEARLQALQARIRPHFLFNSLNAVLSLIRSEPRRAEATLEDLADLFRVLMSDPRNMSSLDEEIRLCKQYLAIEQIRLGERLRVEWQLENLDSVRLQRARVPVLLLQPLLENAVRHGVEPMAMPAPIEVRIARIMDRIVISVINAVDAASVPAPGNHMALDNIRERLALLYDVEAQLSADVHDGRFEVRLHFPYAKGAA